MRSPKVAPSEQTTPSITDELNGICLGDVRLNQRSKQVLLALANNPEASINAACNGWNETHAAYRLFDNSAVMPEAILCPHITATAQRIREQPIVLIAQDTTELDYTSHAPKDAACLNKISRLGLYSHVQLALTPDNLCLGVVGCEHFARDPATLGKANERATWPIEEKESMRWLTGYRNACSLAAECPETHVISVADSEADIYDIFVEHHGHAGPTADFLVRARVQRSTLERNPQHGPQGYYKVEEQVRAAPLLGTKVLELSATPKRTARQAVVEIRALTVTLKPPHARGHLPAVTLNVLLAEEVGGPGDDTDVSWLLFTSLPINTRAQLLLILDYYASRWLIEVFFRTLKTGCGVEKIQLETTARLQNCLAFYLIIAWRILHVTHLNRLCPSVPCTVLFADCEWKSVWRVVQKRKLPLKPPKLSAFMKLLTQLGGYNNRASEPPAGTQVIWSGMRRLADFAQAWLAFGPKS